MTAPSDLIAEDIESYLDIHEHKSMLRFITCASVDDGKSTLIGRLLYESHLVFEDQLAALEADSKTGTQGGELDFALLVDGLAAEREQGITIDVAGPVLRHREAQVHRRRHPGHEQYIRDMVNAGLIVLVSFISPFRSERRMARDMLGGSEFCEVLMDTPLAVAEQRDEKGLYAKARRGQLSNFTGIDSPRAAGNPELGIDTMAVPPEEAAAHVVDKLREMAVLP